MSKKSSKVRIHVWVDEVQLTKLDAMADQIGVDRSLLVRNAIKHMLLKRNPFPSDIIRVPHKIPA
jgi:metal-responsive CopG/Arc/MetJ family transcriptional regulator